MREPDKTSGVLLAYLYALRTELDVEFLRETLRVTLQLLMEMEVSAAIAASPYERNGKRRAYRNGYRDHTWQSPLGEIPLRIPKLRKGTYYPSFIDTLEEAEDALLALVQGAYLQGVSEGSVQETLKRLGITPSDEYQVRQLRDHLDDMVYEFHERPLDNSYSYLWIDVLNLDVPGRSRQLNAVVAVGIRENGAREVLGFEVVPYAEGKSFWRDFLDRLVERGLRDVDSLISETYDGLKPALREILPGVEWQPRSEPAAMLPEAFISAVSPVLWVDTSLPDNNTIISGLSIGLRATIPVWGAIELPHEADSIFITRMVGMLLMQMQATWAVSQPVFAG
jgi:transposase-like protein